MLEDRIIVQDRGGIDAGLAALMQNANKGNMDPAALMAMMNNNGMEGKEQQILLFNVMENKRSLQFQKIDLLLQIIILD